MAQNDAEIHLKVTGEKEAERALDKVGDAAERAGESVEGMGHSSTEAAKATDKAGDSFKSTADEAELLAQKITEAQKAQRELIREFARTGDTDVDKKIKQSGRELNKLRRYAKELVPDTPDVNDAGVSVGKQLITGIRSGLSGAGEYATPALVGLAVLAAPAIGATVAGAVLGGIGTGGIIGGIALAARDERVKAAGAELGQQLLGEFSQLGTPFVEPLVRAASDLGDAGAGWADKLAPSLGKLADKVEPLEEAIEGLVDKALPGFTKAVDASGPVIDAVLAELPNVGEAIGGFFEDIAEDPEAAQEAITQLLVGVEDAIETTGEFVGILVDVYDKALDVADALGLIEPRMLTWNKQTEDGAKANKRLAASTGEATAEIWDYKSAIDALFGRTMDVHDATINYEQSIDDLTEGLTKGKRTLDVTTQAGRDNWQVIDNTAQAIKDLRDANIANNMPLAEANALYEQQFEGLRKTLLQLGYDKRAVDDYINSLKNIPGSVSTAFSAPGLDAIFSKAERLDRTLRQYGGVDLQYGGGFQARAAGGDVAPWQDYIVGENGPELLRMGGSGGRVYNNSQTRAMVGGSGGSATVQVVVSVRQDQRSAMTALAEAIMPYLQIEVMNQGGDPTSVLGAPTYGG